MKRESKERKDERKVRVSQPELNRKTDISFGSVVFVPELSEPPSGLPLEYMVASFPSRMNLNQPLEPLESSRAAASDQM